MIQGHTSVWFGGEGLAFAWMKAELLIDALEL